jgi:hypothetical protein
LETLPSVFAASQPASCILRHYRALYAIVGGNTLIEPRLAGELGRDHRRHVKNLIIPDDNVDFLCDELAEQTSAHCDDTEDDDWCENSFDTDPTVRILIFKIILKLRPSTHYAEAD